MLRHMVKNTDMRLGAQLNEEYATERASVYISDDELG